MSDMKTSRNYQLWKHLADNHNLICTESEIDDIMHVIKERIKSVLPDGIDMGNFEEDDYAGGWNHALNAVEKEIEGL